MQWLYVFDIYTCIYSDAQNRTVHGLSVFPMNIWILMSESLQNPQFLEREFFHKGRTFPDFWLPKQALHVLYAVMPSTGFSSNMTMKCTILQAVARFYTLLLLTPVPKQTHQEQSFPDPLKSILKGKWSHSLVSSRTLWTLNYDQLISWLA